jgi:hypothetical protein
MRRILRVAAPFELDGKQRARDIGIGTRHCRACIG